MSKGRNAALAISITIGILAAVGAVLCGFAWSFKHFGVNITMGTFCVLFFGGIVALAIYEKLEREAKYK